MTKLTFNADLTPHNTFGVAARAGCLAEIREIGDLEQALELADSREMPLLLLGGGSNVLFAGDFPGMVLLMRNRGIEIDRESGRVRVAAGENWHELVRTCLDHGLFGLENLALIPGSAGAAPVQNIGAYGVELESFLVELELFDCDGGTRRTMVREECQFSYRDSALKQPRQRPRVVCSMTLQLRREPAPNLRYSALAEELAGTHRHRSAADDFSPSRHSARSGAKSRNPPGSGNIPPNPVDPRGKAGKVAESAITPHDVFEAVCRIRRRKLPDPAVLGNAGSFFKNPVISAGEFEALRARFDSAPFHPVGEGVKIPAGWLLEQCGFKGCRQGAAGVFERHALILVNRGGASGGELRQLALAMRDRVLAEFGIKLEPEVRIIGGDQSCILNPE